MKHYHLILPLLAILPVGATVGCNKSAVSSPTNNYTEMDDAQKSVSVTSVWLTDLKRDTEVSATVEGYETAPLMSKIDGYVEQVSANIGQDAKKGDVLARLHVPELGDEVQRRQRLVRQAEADLESRQAEVQLAKAHREEHNAKLALRKSELKRISSLVQRGALSDEQREEVEYAVTASQAAIKRSEAEVEAAKAMVNSALAKKHVAQSELQLAESMADYREIRAPFDGLITKRMVDPGEFVRPATRGGGTPLFEITRTDKVRVVVFLAMEQAQYVDEGDPVTLTHIEALPQMKIAAVGGRPLTVSRSSQSFDKDSRMMRAEIDVDNQQLQQEIGYRLKPYDYAKVILTLDVQRDVLTVPKSAVGTNSNGGKYVILVDDSYKCHRVPVNVQLEQGKTVSISADGLHEGDSIVTDNLDGVSHEETLRQTRIANNPPSNWK